jgi:hypothetical protein
MWVNMIFLKAYSNYDRIFASAYASNVLKKLENFSFHETIENLTHWHLYKLFCRIHNSIYFRLKHT